MRLATRCPSCTTMFLVVEDQLRVSEGWVRCGRCTTVFNAIDDLIDVDYGTPVTLDLEHLRSASRLNGAKPSGIRHEDEPQPMAGVATPTDSLAQWPVGEDGAGGAVGFTAEPRPSNQPVPTAEPADTPSEVAASAASVAPADAAELRTDIDLDALERGLPDQDSQGPGQDPWTLRPPHSTPPPRPPPGRDDDLPDQWLRAPSRGTSLTAADAEVPEEDLAKALEGQAEPPRSPKGQEAQLHRGGERSSVWSTSLPDERSGLPTSAAAESDPALAIPAFEEPPSFLRQAERAARWRQPRVRAALAGAAVLAGLVLWVQLALLWRDELAARMPAIAPALHAACDLLGCQVQPLRRIDQISVDSSGLVRVGDETDDTDHRYRLNLVLRNRADMALQAPAIELTLTDPRGEVSVRRVLRVTELGAPDDAVPAGQEWPLRALLATGAQRIDGYTVEIFYP